MDSQTVAMLETDILEMKGFDNAIKSLSQNTVSIIINRIPGKVRRQKKLVKNGRK